MNQKNKQPMHLLTRRGNVIQSFLCALLLMTSVIGGCKDDKTTGDPGSGQDNESGKQPDSFDAQETAAQVNRFCGDCHGTPPPSGFAKADWREEVENGFQFYLESGRSDLKLPVVNDVVRHYRSLAPETLILPERVPFNRQFAEQFEKTAVFHAPEDPEFTARVMWLDVPGRKDPSLVFTGLRRGEFCVTAPEGDDFAVLATLTNPAQFSQADLDGDGHLDFIVADLGSYKAIDHNNGKVFWLRWNDEEKEFEKHVVVKNLGRTADVQPGDFDGDGKLDLVVAEFGWQKSGSVHLVLNKGDSDAGEAMPLRFESKIIDNRHGAINVPVVDLDNDGDMDFVLLLGQEHEAVIFFENQGNASFRKTTLYSNPDPSFGSSGIEPVDIDGDGDLDFLYANGDAFDRFFIKPYHGIRILENKGDLQFVAHHLCYMAGAHRAMPIDFDNDDDLDIVAVANLPENLNKSQEGVYNSVILLRNDGDLNFHAGAIQTGESVHSTVAVGDFDGDGDSDFATGDRSETPDDSRLTIFWNGGREGRPK